jgi:succinate dehydrogenase/fumarate reductase cytochrome b subunit
MALDIVFIEHLQNLPIYRNEKSFTIQMNKRENYYWFSIFQIITGLAFFKLACFKLMGHIICSCDGSHPEKYEV